MQRQTQRWIASLVTSLLLWASMPLPALAVAPGGTAAPVGNPGATGNAHGRKELVERRSAFAKHMDDDTGKKSVEIYSSPIHFRDKQGNWQEIDNRLVASKQNGFAWENAANAFKASFADHAGDKVARMEVGAHWVEWSFAGLKSSKGSARDNQMTYSKVLPGVDLRYTATANGMKEELVITDDDTPHTYRFRLETDLKAVPANGGLRLEDQSGQVSAIVPPPYAVDGAGAETQVSLVAEGQGKYALRINERWLRHPDRVFPIVIDPSVVLQPDALAGMDAWMSKAAPEMNYGGDSELRAGNNGTNVYRSLLKFNLTSIPLGATVTGATLTLNRKSGFGSTTTAQPYELHEVTSHEWLENEASWNNAKSNPSLKWTTPGGDFNATVVDGVKSIVPASGTAYNGLTSWNVGASIASMFNTGQNLGFLLKSAAEDTGTTRQIHFTGSDSLDNVNRPKMTVTYTEDGNPPQVTLTVNSTVSGEATVTATATDTESGVNRVEFLVDGGVVGTVITPLPYTLKLDTTKYPDGPHTVDVRAYDKAGNVGILSRKVILSDTFNDTANLMTAETTASVSNGMVTLVGSGTPVTLGTPTASSTKASQDHTLGLLKDGSASTYWKSLGQTSSSGVETVILDLGSSRSVSNVRVMPDQQSDNLLARAEFLDSNGNSITTTQANWVNLNVGTSGRQYLSVPVPGGNPAKIRLSFSNLAHDVLTGLYHANVAEVLVQNTTTDWVVDHYVVYQATETQSGIFSCTTAPHVGDGCTVSGTLYPNDSGFTSFFRQSDQGCSNCYDHEETLPLSVSFSQYYSGGPPTLRSDPASSPGGMRCTPNPCTTGGGVLWPSWLVSVGTEYWSPNNNGGLLTYSNDYSGRVTNYGGTAPGNNVTYWFYWTTQWNQWTYNVQAETGFQKTRYTATSSPYTNQVTLSYVPVGDSYLESNGVTNIVDGNASTHWVGTSASPTNSRSNTAWVEVPFNASGVNSVYVDPLFEGMSATFILTNAGLQQGQTVSIPYLRKGTYSFPQVTADKLRLEMTNLQGPTEPYFAGLNELKVSNAPVGLTGQVVGKVKALPLGATQVIFDAFDVQASGTQINYQLKFDSGTPVAVTPGVPFDVPAGAQTVQMLATLTGNGTVSPILYNWSLTTSGTGQQVTFQNGSAATNPLVDQPVVTIANPSQLAEVTGAVPVQITTTATDVTKVEYYVDGVKLATVNAQPWGWTWDASKAPSGSHVIQALTFNPSGKTGGATTVVTVPVGSPTNLTAVPDTASHAITLTWQPVGAVTQYKLYRATDPLFTTAPTIRTVAGSSYTDTDPKVAGTTYYYRVAALDSAGVEGRPSLTRSAVPQTPPTGWSRLGSDRFYPYVELDLPGMSSYVNLTNGNLVTQVTDLVLPGTGLMMAVRRSLNSFPDTNGGGKPHWRWNHEITATTDPTTGAVTLTNSDGAVYTFPFVNGTYQRLAGVYIWLNRADGVLTATHKNGVAWTFSAMGRLDAMSDRNGNTIQYTYDAQGRIRTATNSTGQSVDYTFDAAGNLASVTYGPTSDRRTISYAFDSVTGALTRVTDLMGSTWTYAYDADLRFVGVLSPSGSAWTIGYNSAGQVSSSIDPLAAANGFVYQAGNTTLTNARGNTSTFTYNTTGQLTQLVRTATSYDSATADSLISTYQYDGDYNMTSFTDPRGKVHSAVYDLRGNLISQTEPAADSSSPSSVTNYLYDDTQNPDLPTEIRSPLNLSEKRQYDGSGNLISVTVGNSGQAPSSTVQYSYFANGMTAAQRDMWGGITHYEYDSMGHLIKQVDAMGNSSQSVFDWFGKPTRVTDPEGNETFFAHDHAGRQVQVTFADGTSQSMSFDRDGRGIKTMDNNGNVKQYGYDKAGRTTRVTDPTGVTRYQYDAVGNPTAVTNVNGWTTTFSYDEIDRVKSQSLSVTQPSAATYTTFRKYDAVGNVVKLKNANGHETIAEYDNLGRQTAVVIDPTGVNARNTRQYDGRGRKVAEIDPLWHKLSYLYDDLDRLVETRENLLSGVQFSVETAAVTQFAAVSGASLSVDTTKAFNGTTSLKVRTTGAAVGEGVRVKVPVRVIQGQTLIGTAAVTGSGNISVRLLDLKNNVNVTSGTVALGSNWNQVVPINFTASADSDNFFLEIATVGAAQAVTFNVDALDVDQRTAMTYSTAPQGTADIVATRTSTVVNVLGQTTVTRYDLLGRVVGTTDPKGKQATTTYHTGDNRVERKDALGQISNVVYDSRGRIGSVEYPDGSRVAFTYDGNGNRLTMSDSLGLTSFSYDAMNRPMWVIDPFGRLVTYKYTGMVLSEITNLTGKVTYAYNEAGSVVNMTVVDAQSNSETTSFRYDGVGHLVQQNQGTQQVVWNYNTSEQLTSIRGTQNGSQLYSLEDTYDLAGNRVSYTRDGNDSHNYTYDPLYRLTRATDNQSNKVRTYDYDAVGNRLRRTETTNGTVTTDEQYTYDAASRLLTQLKTANGISETTSYEYDANGNQTRFTGAKGSTTFTYDFENRLLEGHFPDGSVVAHRYDGDGQRMYSKDPGQETYYLYALGAIVADLDGAGATIAAYYRGPGNRLVSTHQRTGSYLYQADGLGSVIGLTKTDGSWDSKYAYDEFGIVSTIKGSAWNTFEFTGAPYHESAGLYQLGARYYNPTLGRFISRDTHMGNPWQPLTQNLYSYVGNNPVNFIDPTGHEAVSVNVRTFIPFGWVTLTLLGTNNKGFMKGDGHEFGESPGEGTSKTFHSVSVDFDAKTVTNSSRTVAATTYRMPCFPDIRKVCEYKTGLGPESDLQMSFKFDGDTVAVTMTANSPTPLCHRFFVCGRINYNMTFTLNRGGDGAVSVIGAKGRHEGFPAYEAWVQSGDQVLYLYRHDPRDTGETGWSLYGKGEFYFGPENPCTGWMKPSLPWGCAHVPGGI